MIELKSASYSYQSNPIIHNLSCSVKENRITAILGPNGAGKSTLLKLMGNLAYPKTGEVLFNGKNISRMAKKALARKLSFLSQNPVVPEGYTVEQLVMLGRFPYIGLWGKPGKKDRQVVRRAIQCVDLEELQDRPVNCLSGGQLQRAWIAMAIAQDTPWILLDEPTSFLDLSHQLNLLDLLTSLKNDHKKTIVMVIHDLNLASYYAEELIVIKNGQLVGQGAVTEVLDQNLLQSVFDVNMRMHYCGQMNLRTFIPENPSLNNQTYKSTGARSYFLPE